MNNHEKIMDEFREWLKREHKQPSGKPYAEGSVNMYYSALKNETGLIANLAKSVGFEKITDVKMVDQLTSIVDMVEKDENVNGTHKTDTNALKHYIKFIEEKSLKASISQSPEGTDMKWEKSQAERVCDECFDGQLPEMDEYAEHYLKLVAVEPRSPAFSRLARLPWSLPSGSEAVRELDLGEHFTAIIGNQNPKEWWKQAKKWIDNELQKNNDEEISESPSALEQPLNGLEVLKEATIRLGIDLCALVAEIGLWAHPQVHELLIKENATGAWFPNVRRGKKGERKGECVDGEKIDDNSDANRAIKAAIGLSRKNIKCFDTCHIWKATCYNADYHTTIANIVLLPSPLKGLSDAEPEVSDMLKYRAFELYKWCPKGEADPKKPKNYPTRWRNPGPFTPKIKKSIQQRQNKLGDY